VLINIIVHANNTATRRKFTKTTRLFEKNQVIASHGSKVLRAEENLEMSSKRRFSCNRSGQIR